MSASPLSLLVALVSGILTWTLLEYLLHRFFGHHRALVRRSPFGIEHTAHHSKGDYFAATWKKASAAAVVLALMTPLSMSLLGLGNGLAYSASFVSFYLVYEWLHRRLHTAEGVGPYGRWARRHHFFHHFHDPSKNHGVTSPLWDWVFGTAATAPRITVPEKLAMRWLVDAESGDVHRHLQGRYDLRRAKKG
ncbi:MAG: sterol desaturase family protein [Myxococcales bacterium]|nr:sterol desaturase family protein [Myxococcales bacterium]